MQHAIHWPQGYVPGHVDNYVSNEIIIAGLSAAQVWQALADTRLWADYYDNVAEVQFPAGGGPLLSAGARFAFVTFSFPVQAQVVEFVPPQGDQPGRVAWHAWVEGDALTRLDVHHAWLFEDLPGHRVRILTQETQNGAPARQLAQTLPNPMLNAHQAWIEGLARCAQEQF